MSRCHARTLPQPRAASARRPASFALRLLTRVTRPVTLLQQPRRLPPCAAARNALGGQWRRGAASVWARPPTRGHLQRTHVGPRQRWKSSANALPKRLPELACLRSLHCRQRPCHHVARSAIPHRKPQTWLTLLPAQQAATSHLWQNVAPTLPDARTPDEASSTPVPVQPLPAQARSRWQRGPPAEGPLPPTNSWIYMPLLLDGAGLLCPAAAAGWRACAPYAVPWPALVTALPTSALRLPEDPIASVRSAGDAEAEPGRPPEDWASACRSSPRSR